jgi:hypothetical protein
MKDEGQGDASGTGKRKPRPGDHFLQLMFFRTSGASKELPRRQPRAALSVESSRPLRQSKTAAGTQYYLPHAAAVRQVQPNSPAIDVMTDLKKVTAVTTTRFATIDEANQTMITRGVRALFVVDEDRAVAGIITATDVLGEKPIQFTQQQGIRHDSVLVRDIMTPADRLEVIDLVDVLQATVCDVVATLRLSGRQHALVVEQAPEQSGVARHAVRGIFSLTQIARQLGIASQVEHDIGRTFAEIEAAIGS